MQRTDGKFWCGTAELSYSVLGDGPPLIMLHGNGEDRSCFDGQAEFFAARFRVVLPDSRGHGASSHGNEPLTVELMAADVLALMDELKLEKADVLGFSDGGNIAIRLALDAPERVRRLVLSGANMTPDGLKLRCLFPMWLRHMWLMVKSIFNERAAYDIELLELMTKQPRFYGCDLNELKPPVLITAGERDMIRPEHTKYMHRLINGSELLIFKGCTHFAHRERPEEYNAAVMEFLTKER